MTLQRRVMLFLLLSAPLVWAVGLFYGLGNAREEINELFDTQQVRLAQQLNAMLPGLSSDAPVARPRPSAAAPTQGDADLDELSIAVWNRQGHLLLADREGASIPYRADADGFTDLQLGDQAWRAYYLRSDSG
ncbi:MAG: sensor histidine kinase N-terminal domain-containing protein, partial [Rubrivivax sp.]